MKDIVILHRKNNQLFNFPLDPLATQSVGLFKTCLRQIALVSSTEYARWRAFHLLPSVVEAKDEVYEGKNAWQFLLEVLCGLHSPVFGETEVFGQFRKFVEELPMGHFLKADSPALQFLFRTIKQIRTEFLHSIGGLSYGHVIRKKLKDCSEVSLWGFGQLAQEVYPWIKEKQIQVIVRRPFYSQQFSVVSAQFRQNTKAHIIAAPLSDEEVVKLVADPDCQMIIDLRGHTLINHDKIVSLLSVMTEIESLKSEQKAILPDCRAAISDRIDLYFLEVQHRPYGWEDLCC